MLLQWIFFNLKTGVTGGTFEDSGWMRGTRVAFHHVLDDTVFEQEGVPSCNSSVEKVREVPDDERDPGHRPREDHDHDADDELARVPLLEHKTLHEGEREDEDASKRDQLDHEGKDRSKEPVGTVDEGIEQEE